MLSAEALSAINMLFEVNKVKRAKESDDGRSVTQFFIDLQKVRQNLTSSHTADNDQISLEAFDAFFGGLKDKQELT